VRSRGHLATADRERTGGIYAGTVGFLVVWGVGFANGIPFRDTVWKAIACAVVVYVLVTFLLRIILRLRAAGPPVGGSDPATDVAPEPGEAKEGR